MAEGNPIQNQQVAFTVIDEEAALVHPVDSSLYWLSPVATRIWELSDGQRSIEEIAQVIYEEFDVDFDRALRDTTQMIEAFQEKQLIETIKK